MKKIPLPQPPHLLKSVPPVPQSPVKSAPPVPQSPVKSAPPVPQSSLKLPPPVPQSSLKLPPPVPQSVAPPVPQSVVPPVSNAKILGKFLTGYKDTDYKILSSLPDKDLINFCVSNRNPICEDENFWKNRLINKWGMEAANLKVEKYKEKNKKGILEEKPRTWKSYYLSLLYYDTRYFPKKAASKAALAGLEDIVMFYGDKANRHNIVYNAAKGGHMELAKKISGFLDNAIVWAGIRTGKKELLINEKSVKTIMLIGPSEIIGYRTGKSRNIEHIKWVRGIFWDVNYSDKNKHRYIKDFDFAVIRGLAKYGDLGNIKKIMESFNIKYDDIINHSDIINSAVESRNEELLKAFSTYQKNPIKGYIGVGRAGDIKYFDEYTDRIIKKIFPKAELNSFDLYDVLEGAVEKGHTSFFAEFLNKINLLGDNNPFYIPGNVTLREFYRRILNKENIEKWLEVAKDKGHKEMYNYLDTVLRSKRM